MSYLASTTRVIKYFKPGKDGADAVRYWLVPSHTSVKVKAGATSASPATVSCRLMKQVGDDSPATVTPSDEGLVIRYGFGGSGTTTLYTYTAGSSLKVPVEEGCTAVVFNLYRAATRLIDTQTVSIVRDGISATTYYTWIRYADDAIGTGMSDSPYKSDNTFKAYIGFAYNRTSATESNDPGDYTWSRYQGEQGVTLYSWIKYSDGPLTDGYPSAMYDTPKDSTVYIGIAANQSSETKGSDPKAYSWSKFRGDDGTSIKIKDVVQEWTASAPGSLDEGEKWAVDAPFEVLRGGMLSGKPTILHETPAEGDIYRVEGGEHAGHLICATSGRWVDLGEIQGPKGDKGDDAVSIMLVPAVVEIKKGKATQQKVFVDVYEGKERIIGNYALTPINKLVGTSTACANIGENGRQGYQLACGATADDNFELEFNVIYKNVQYPQSISVRTISDGAQGPQGRHGPALRVQRWEKCPEGFLFQCGEEGDDYKDVVMFTSDSTRCYECIKGHAKTAANDPVKSIQDSLGLWRGAADLNLVATDILLANYARIDNLGVGVIDICDYDDRGERTAVYFYADRERLWCNYGTFNHISIDDAEITDATITSGKIAGFDIEGSILTNSSKDMDAAIIFRNDAEGCFAGIGTDMNSSVAGDAKTLARFENSGGGSMANSTVYISSVGSRFNTALTLNASGGAECNYAFCGVGNGVLNGWIGGYKFSRHVANSANSGKAVSPFSLKENNVWILHAAEDGCMVPLPTRLEVQDTLNLMMGTPFCIRLTIVGDVGCRAIKLAGRDNSSYAGESFPVIIDNNGNVASTLTLQQGDSFEILLVYFPDDTRNKDGFSLKYTARMLNHTN